MLKKIHPKIIGLLLLSVLILFFFLYALYMNNMDARDWLSTQNHTQEVSRDVQKLNAMISRERSMARKYILSGNPAALDSVGILRAEVMKSIGGVKQMFAGGDSSVIILNRLTELLGKSYLIQDTSLRTRRNGITTRQNLLIDSINIITNSLVIAQGEKMFKRRKQFAEETQSDTIEILVGGLLVFVFVVVILFRFNKDNQRLNIAQQEAGISELKYRGLIENAGQVMYTADLDGRITFANRKATYLTGYTSEELIGMHISGLIDPTMRSEVLQHYARQVRYQIPETIREFNLVTKQGELKLVGQSVIIIVEEGAITGFQCVVWDVNEVTQLQRELHESNINLRKNSYQLQSILDNASAVIYVKDLEGRYQIVNRRFLAIMNAVEDRVINRTDYDLTTKESADFYYEMDQKVIRTKKGIEAEAELDTPTGKMVLLIGKFPLLDEHGEIFGICGIATDITERTIYQRELIEARRVAESAKQLQEQFLANMSHEIRTPMNGIQGMTDLLLGGALTEQQKEFVTFIKRCVNNLLVLINDILDFSKIQAGKLNIEEIAFDPRKIIDNVKMDFAHRVKEKGLVFSLDIDPAIPQTLMGDPYRLTQVLINFVGNAIKFTEKGHVTLGAHVLSKKDNGIVLQVIIEDTGIGIAPQNLESIFESFQQANTNTSRLYGGTGLGLAICKQLVEMQGGTVAVASTLGEGSKFVVNIPYRYAENNMERTRVVNEGVDYYPLLAGKRVLAAEDNEVNKNLLLHVLKKTGITPDIVSNGQEAVDRLKEREYDVVIMDLQMPLMDGYAATRYIREELRLTVPILAMTATAMKGEITKCLAVGMNDYMAKPFNFTDLYDKLVKLTTTRYHQDERKQEAAQVAGERFYDLSILEDIGDARNTIEMIDMVVSNMTEQLVQIKTAIAAGDWKTVSQIAHKAKSSVGMLGVRRLLALLENMERFSKDETKRGDIASQYEEAIVLFEKLSGLLAADKERLQKTLG